MIYSMSRTKPSSRRRRLRGGNHGVQVPAQAQAQAQAQAPAQAPAPAPEPSVAGYVTPGVSALTPFAGGSRRRGGSALADIAIPAVFIAANNMVGVKRTMGKSMKKRRGSRVRFSRRRR